MGQTKMIVNYTLNLYYDRWDRIGQQAGKRVWSSSIFCDNQVCSISITLDYQAAASHRN